MYGTETFLWFILAMFYISCIFTVCVLTFRKGHTVLGIVGFFFPILWLVGAFIPAEAGFALRRRAADGVPAADSGIHEMSRQDSI